MQLLTQHLQAISDSTDFPFIDRWLEEWIDVPIVAASLYLLLVWWVPENFMKNRDPYHLRVLNILWNFFLATFSFVGAYYSVPRMAELLFAESISGLEPSPLRYTANMTAAMRRNIVIPNNFVEGGSVPVAIRGSFDTSVCVWKDDMYRRGIIGIICLAFMFSKIPEMLDTAFLVFQKKSFPFLHWYHHTTVMLYCWHAWVSPTASGLWYATMNYCVHSLMYSYYFISAIGYGKHVRRFASTITFLQIAQMIVGSFICAYVAIRKQFFGGCDSGAANARLALMMYGSYLYLFSQYFVQRYVKKSSAKAKADKEVTGARPKDADDEKRKKKKAH